MIRNRIMGAVASAALVGGGLVAFAPAPAGAAQALLTCQGLSAIGSLNPTLKSNDAAYAKVALKDSDGTKTEYLSNAAIPADTTACFVDAGISTNQGGQDVKYLLDDQTNGNAALTRASTAAPDGKNVASSVGSATCNTSDTVNVNATYPQSYPLQGKTIWKFEQLTPLGAQIQIQQYIRTGRDLADTNAQHITVKGIVIKGPGIGGDVSAVLNFFPTSSVKNTNVLECVDADVTNDDDPVTPGVQILEASLAELTITQADGSDVGTSVDDWLISIP